MATTNALTLDHGALHPKRSRFRMTPPPPRRLLASACLLLLCVPPPLATVRAAEPADIAAFTNPPPLEPDQAPASFRLQQGFSLQLVAAEPLLVDPVDVAYDEFGLAYAVEMRGYPLPEKPEQARPEPISRVRLLIDDDNDGRFDRSTVFLDKLDWPTSVCCYRGGVFIADAPDIWYARDTDGDGVADERRKVLTGFKRDNVQALVNSLKWGLDHHIHGAASGNGGTLTVPDKPGAPPVPVTRRDFRFDPLAGSVEAISGGARFGASFDDFGNRFLCNIRNPIQHVPLPLAPLLRNPLLALPSLLHDAAESGETLPVFRISPVEAWREYRARRWVQERVNFPRSELVGAGYFTSSSGVTVYRGDAYPDDLYGHVFVADVAANVVHRERLVPDGVTFKAERTDQGAEFVASTDNWFRPVNFVNAPDGTLHVVDMYRLNIEHPWSIPDDIRVKMDLTAGNDRGRLWRLAPPGYRFAPIPKLGEFSTEKLVAELASRNSWRRETAHRLLWERQDQSAIAPLRALRDTTSEPLARLHVLWSLDGLGGLTWEDIATAARDLHPGVREHALQVASHRFGKDERLRELAIAAATDDAPRVRLQAALALGNDPAPSAVAALASIARRDCGDAWMRLAILSVPPERAASLLTACVDPPKFSDAAGATRLFNDLGRIVGQFAASDTVGDDTGRASLPAGANLPLELEFAIWSGWVEGVQRRRDKSTAVDWIALQESAAWKSLEARARAALGDEQASLPLRVQAVALLQQNPLAAVRDLFVERLSPREPRELQLAAVRGLGSYGTPAAAELLLARYKALSPAVRAEIVDMLASRPAWHAALFGAIDAGTIRTADVSVPRRALLLRSADAVLKARAESLFGASAVSSRQAALDSHAKTLELRSDPTRGFEVFKRECAQCHRSRDVGFEVGPPLASIRNRSPQELLVHILDPNREVGPNFVDYVAVLKDGRSLTGLLASETETRLVLLRPQGLREEFARADLDEFASSGKSLMPEGLEQRLPAQDLADLIDYLLHPDAVTATAPAGSQSSPNP